MQLCWQNYCLSATTLRHKSKLTALGRFQTGLAYKRKSLVFPFSVEVAPGMFGNILMSSFLVEVNHYTDRHNQANSSLPPRKWCGQSIHIFPAVH